MNSIWVSKHILYILGVAQVPNEFLGGEMFCSAQAFTFSPNLFLPVGQRDRTLS